MNKDVIIDIENSKDNDLISRQAVLDIFGYVMDYWKEHAIDVEPHEIKDALIEQYEFTAKQLNELPSVTSQTKTGHWIEHKHNGISYIECSECSSWFLRMYLTRNSYCPNCGARMVKP